MKTQISGALQTILVAYTEALRSWSDLVESHAEQAAEDGRVRELVRRLVDLAARQGASPAVLLNVPKILLRFKPGPTKSPQPKERRQSSFGPMGIGVAIAISGRTMSNCGGGIPGTASASCSQELNYHQYGYSARMV